MRRVGGNILDRNLVSECFNVIGTVCVYRYIAIQARTGTMESE